MACACLDQFYILRPVVDVGQDSGTEADRRDILCETRVLLDTLTHLADLGIRERLISTKEELPSGNIGKVEQGQHGQANGTSHIKSLERQESSKKNRQIVGALMLSDFWDKFSMGCMF